MKKIKISTAGGGKPFIKQLKSFDPVWDDCEFYINEEISECDLWVIYGGLEKIESVLCPANGTLFITTEPPNVKKYAQEFIDQFATVMTCDPNMNHKNIIYSQQALPWWVGHKVQSGEEKFYQTYYELKNSKTPKKNKLASIIVSNKSFTKDHKKRYEFFKKLEQELGDKIDFFGIGSNVVDDKWDAIAPYKYHIVLENTSLDDWWTEKLTDAFLGESYPIYYGCTNIYDYFPRNSLSVIDINNPTKAIQEIKKIIGSDTYENSVAEIKKAKHLILDKFQIFPMLASYAKTHHKNSEKIKITLMSEKEKGAKNILRKIFSIMNVNKK